MKTPSKTQIALSGMWLNVFGLEEILARPAPREIAVLLFMHGRFGSAERIEDVVNKTYVDTNTFAKEAEGSGGARRQLLIVTFDQRNHGTRKISKRGQESWSEGNPNHAQDMLAMQEGTAADCSLIADFLESFLFPNGEAEVVQWAVTGISLGGHATWIVLKNDPRFDIGVPMLGCPSYRVLMKQRAEKNGLPWAPPHMPDSLLKLLGRIDPDSVDFQATGQSNPYYGKAVLVCHGDKDDLVPWTAGKAFVDGLQVGPSGAKRVFLEPGRGHETSSGMVEELSKWLAEHALRPRSATSSHGKSAL